MPVLFFLQYLQHLIKSETQGESTSMVLLSEVWKIKYTSNYKWSINQFSLEFNGVFTT